MPSLSHDLVLTRETMLYLRESIDMFITPEMDGKEQQQLYDILNVPQLHRNIRMRITDVTNSTDPRINE